MCFIASDVVVQLEGQLWGWLWVIQLYKPVRLARTSPGNSSTHLVTYTPDIHSLLLTSGRSGKVCESLDSVVGNIIMVVLSTTGTEMGRTPLTRQVLKWVPHLTEAAAVESEAGKVYRKMSHVQSICLGFLLPTSWRCSFSLLHVHFFLFFTNRNVIAITWNWSFDCFLFIFHQKLCV